MARSVFYDIADTPDEAANLSARSLVMIAIGQRVREQGWTQAEAAKALSVRQPRVSDLMNGKIDKFSLDALVNMLPAVGLTFSVEAAQPTQPARRLVGVELPRLQPRKRAVAAGRNERAPAAAARGDKGRMAAKTDAKTGMVAKTGIKGAPRSPKK